ncbi:hypothetical protein X805_06220 [Sphaerotilus natans subsp. natans DSM 6575]|uniref:Type I restriction modification DNA specificity domain-containing protein n=1 Tax=Sphaerotilus natans subsp. natans DSM 6575 TaxID=1286631 RepID=A0A059KRM3_9BURK|nr:restriction endonuclease subunit S [Sphaerotilus natans]KDB53768.1 hypothetical protein X805_06220 [Sphaerotilus natans subsp. natans DSM 6575]SIR97738.1 type I restriction enzyme, S subunit [Sphaerotilus natans]
MSLPKYPHYKPSGVEWLGEVPAHWDMFRMGSLFRDVNEPGNDELPVLSVSIHDGVSDKELDENEMDRKVTRSDDRSKYKLVMPGDLTYNMMRAWQGGFGTVAAHGMVSPAYVVARPVRRFMTFFAEMILRTPNAVAEMKRHSRGVTDFRLRLYWEDFKCIEIALPPADEQAEIVDFIKHETSKIDALIAEQAKLIALLAEKRQATISHAVTRGLDPAAPMKDSGVAWLGEVPAHWEVKRVKDCGCEVVDCKNRTPEPHVEGDYFVVRTSCVKDGQFNPEPGYWTDEANFIEWTAKGRPQAGDVLFTREAPAGEACLAPEDLDFCLGQRMMYIRPPKDFLLSKFLLYSIYGGLAREKISEKSKGSTVGHLRVGEVGELPLLVPPLGEQQELVDFIGDELEKIKNLAVASNRAIALLKERRAALIAAAVTGQIDVRGWRVN